MYLAGDYAGARTRFEALSALYADVSRSRRLTYWRARCLATEGKTEEARNLFASLASARPADIYARFAQKRAAAPPPSERPPVGDPSTATATYARVDELLRHRLDQGRDGVEVAACPHHLLPPLDLREVGSRNGLR